MDELCYIEGKENQKDDDDRTRIEKDDDGQHCWVEPAAAATDRAHS